MLANNAKPVHLNQQPQSVPASQTGVPISGNFGQTAGAAGKYLRLDLYTGVTTIASAITAKHQHTNLLGLWSDGKTATLSASTQKAATPDFTTSQLAVTSHGYSENQPIVISAATVPTGLAARTIYYAKVLDANTIQLKSQNEGSLVGFSDNGATVKTTAVQLASISYQDNVAGDQATMPLRNLGRVVLSTGAGDSVDILAIKLNQEE